MPGLLHVMFVQPKLVNASFINHLLCGDLSLHCGWRLICLRCHAAVQLLHLADVQAAEELTEGERLAAVQV